MSLLNFNDVPRVRELAQIVYHEQFELDKRLSQELSDADQQALMNGILHDLSSIDIAIKLKDSDLYYEYIRWICALLSYHMPFVDVERRKEYLTYHYASMIKHLNGAMNESDYEYARTLLENAIEITKGLTLEELKKSYISIGDYHECKKELLHLLLNKDLRGATQYIEDLSLKLPLDCVFTDIMKDTMREVGELWYENKISVAQEHYCSMAIQSLLSRFQSRIFEQPRRNKKAVIACMGSELHEIGARMISDLLEYNGWDSLFLGAAVPLQGLCDMLLFEQPQLVALSVCMPQGILPCIEAIKKIKEISPQVKVAVGGRAFIGMKDVKIKTGADIYCDDFKDLLHEVDRLCR